VRRRYRHLTRDEVERDIARLADGTLDPSKRARVERIVAGSPELQASLREQRHALAATRLVVQTERAPLTLRMSRRTLMARRGHRRTPLLGLGALGTTGALIATIATLGGSQAGLTVAQASTLAARPATVAVSEPPDDAGVTLPGLQVAGLPFPYWEDHFAWSATGARSDRVDGHETSTVFYRRGGEHVAYTIVAGHSLPDAAGARTIVFAGTLLTSYSLGGRTVVTWLRRGHTCVLSGRGVPVRALLDLAGWRGHGGIPY
jgi:anti-sigma factor RsiW